MTTPFERPTYVTVLTPWGTGAIAVVTVDGPRAWDIIHRLFQPLSDVASWPPTEPTLDEFWLGRFSDETKAKIGDEVVVAMTRRQPDPRVEVQCHGGIEVVNWILDLLTAAGAQACLWQDMFRHTDDDRIRAEAALSLAFAPTVRTAGILLDQYNGALGRAFADIRAALDQNRIDDSKRLGWEVTRYANVGLHLTAPWKVTVLGAPNVGKSSLVNAIAGFHRSVVAPIPGTTRDLVTTRVAIDGWPVELVDTAGLRTESRTLEDQGIALARAIAHAADLCLWVLDASASPVWPEMNLGNVRFIVNKIDLRAVWDLDQATDAVRISAQSGDGIPSLISKLAEWLVPDPPPPGAAVPFSEELVARVAASSLQPPIADDR